MYSFEDFLNEKKSPYKPETLAKYKKKWEEGEQVPFGVEASLKAQGMIPRADGSYQVSPEYKKEKGSFASNLKKAVSPVSKKPDSHTDKVEKRIHKEEKERLEKGKKTERIEKHPENKSDNKNPDDKWFEGAVKKQKEPKKLESFKETKKKRAKSSYKQKPVAESLTPEGTIITFEEFKIIAES
jgi:hypothetical protein